MNFALVTWKVISKKLEIKPAQVRLYLLGPKFSQSLATLQPQQP